MEMNDEFDGSNVVSTTKSLLAGIKSFSVDTFMLSCSQSHCLLYNARHFPSIMASPDLMTGLGAALAIFLSSAGSAIASVQGGLFALCTGGGILGFVPIVISGVLAIYGIIIAIILCGQRDISEQDGYKNFSAGLAVGLACLMSGIGISGFLEKHMRMQPTTNGRRGEQQEPLIASSPSSVQVPPTSWSLFMVLVFLEAIGLYGLIVALFLSSH